VTYSGFVNSDTEAVLAGAPSVTTTATATSSIGSYPITATAGTLAAANYSFAFVPGTLTVLAKAITFTFSNLSYTYDGSAKTATVTPSDAAATFTSDLTKGPAANSYIVSAIATGNYMGSGTATLIIAAASQAITLTPTTATLFANQPGTFTAAGGQNAYVWGGSGGASGSAAAVTLTFAAEGTYTLTVYNAASNDYLQSNTVTATVTVTSAHVVTSLSPVESSFTVTDASSPMNGRTYNRMWQSAGWNAYLGRSGVKFQVKGAGYPAVKSIELHTKPPGGDWTVLATQAPTTPSTSADETLSVMLGDTVPGEPLVPASFLQGNALTGVWLFRARLQDSNGGWSDFSEEVPVNVVLPLVTKTVSGQTVPPAGALGDWFTASPVQSFSIPLWVP
jgi:hypothetical protein